MPNSIELIKDAEQKSDGIVAEARLEAAKIIDGAESAALSIVGEAIKTAKDYSAGKIAEARRGIDARADSRAAELEADVKALSDAVRGTLAEATQLIYESIASSEGEAHVD